MYADLGWIYQLERKNTYALANFQKAVDCEPSNPRFLDLLLKISILLKNKDLAWRAYNGLKEADPENKKLPELKEEITTLPDLAPPAELVSWWYKKIQFRDLLGKRRHRWLGGLLSFWNANFARRCSSVVEQLHGKE